MNFNKIIDLIIDNLEGGYYHPNMKVKDPVKYAVMGKSGETMFGIDRLHGGDINTNQAGRKFWSIIDGQNASNNWKYNYKGGVFAPELKKLVAEMMLPRLEKYFDKYLSEEAQRIVKSSDALTFNFAYAVWNGVKWFERFAAKINAAVEIGIKDRSKLFEIAIQSRLDSGVKLLADGGRKIAKMTFNNYRPIIIIGLSVVALTIVGVILYKKGYIK